MKMLLLAILLLLAAPAVAQNKTPEAVRVQITYVSVNGGPQTTTPGTVYFDAASRNALQTFTKAVKGQHLTTTTSPGPVVTAPFGKTATKTIWLMVGAPTMTTPEGKIIDSHIGRGWTHTVTATPRVLKDGEIAVTISLRDAQFTQDNRTNVRVSSTTPRVVKKTLVFHPGDTLLLTPPVPNTAGDHFAFATVTTLPAGKG